MGDLHALHLGEVGREQALLKGDGDRPLAFVEPRVLERDRDARRDRFGELHVGTGVAPPGLGLDELERAENSTAAAEGHDDRRPHAQPLEHVAHGAVGSREIDELVVDLRVELRRARAHRGRDAGEPVGVVGEAVA